MTKRSIQVAAHAKTNLFLHVLAREESGYHGIETLFALLELHDKINLETIQDGVELTVEGADTGPTQENLVYRAAVAALDAANASFGVRVHLEKTIPVQAGLGGGSSDAAATLIAVNMLADEVLSQHELFGLASALGSDVPFFVSGAAFALAWGRGERLLEIPGPGSAPALVVVPDFGISTAEAYRDLAADRVGSDAPRSRSLFLNDLCDWGRISELSANDFEKVLGNRAPELEGILAQLRQTNPILARLCGSGSAILAVYEKETDRDAARAQMSAQNASIATSIRSDRASFQDRAQTM